MAGICLRESQVNAVKQMKNGCILCGGVGSGKSRTALAYYYILNGGKLGTKEYEPMDKPKDLYIITTAKKRDSLEWESEMRPFALTPKEELKYYKHTCVVDSWNNIKKYRDVKDAFFIFDEDRVTGDGAWVKSFLQISKHNDWVILSATPGDTWSDYMPVFIANGFFKNKTEFRTKHCVYKWQANGKYPVIDRYINIGRLVRLRDNILVDIKHKNPAVAHHENIFVGYDINEYKSICKNRWNPWEDKPIENASEFCMCLRRSVNSDQSREVAVLELLEKHPRAIIFYNYDFELEILRRLLDCNDCRYAEWNGHKHQEIPETNNWVYLVHYNACEGWNCIRTDTIIFYSQNYSYKTMVQAAGRIDRMNTPYTDLYYYHLKSKSGIDLAISRALKNKKKFNENRFING